MRRLVIVVAVIGIVATACGGAGPTPPTAAPSQLATATAAIEPTATLEGPSMQPTARPPATWSLLTATGALPAAREDHTWTVDGSAASAYLFGGRDGGTTYGDLFAFDLLTNTWRALAPTGLKPPGRFGHEAAWVDGVGLVIFAGQANPNTFFGDLWAYDPAVNRWTEMSAAGDAPVPRYGSCSGVGADGRLWISHGFTEDRTRFFDTKAYDFDLGRWTDLTPAGRVPVERCLHACWWTADGRFALYGGQTTTVSALGDLWSLLPGGANAAGTWMPFEGDVPAERALPAFARLGDDELVFGGRSIDGSFLSDAYVVDGRTLTVAPLAVDGAAPIGRAAATLIEDYARARELLFGGKDGSGSFSELWQLTSP